MACVVVAALAAGAVVLVPRLHGHRPETAPRAHPATSISRSTPPQTQAPPPSPGPSITSQSPPPVRLVCHASLLAGAGRATAADIEKAHDFVLPSAQGTAHIVLDPKTDDPLLITSWFWGPPNATVTPPNAPPETVGSRTFEYGMASWTSGGQLMTTPVVREEVKPAANWTVGNGTWAQTGIQGQPTTWPKDQHSWASRVLAAVTASGRDLRVTGGELSPAQVMAMANGGWEIIAGSTPALNTGHAVAGRPGQATVVTAVDQVEYRKVDPKSKRLTTVAMWYPGSGTTVKVPAPPVTTPPGCTLNG